MKNSPELDKIVNNTEKQNSVDNTTLDEKQNQDIQLGMSAFLYHTRV